MSSWLSPFRSTKAPNEPLIRRQHEIQRAAAAGPDLVRRVNEQRAVRVAQPANVEAAARAAANEAAARAEANAARAASAEMGGEYNPKGVPQSYNTAQLGPIRRSGGSRTRARKTKRNLKKSKKTRTRKARR